MKANEDKHLEEFTARLMGESSLEKPTAEFTSKVMMQALAVQTRTATQYKPLISKPFWFIIFGAVGMLMVYLFTHADTRAGGPYDADLNTINNKFINGLVAFKFSDITLFTVVLLTVMLLIQITFIKRYFDKRVGG
jgi:hypothetical protein